MLEDIVRFLMFLSTALFMMEVNKRSGATWIKAFSVWTMLFCFLAALAIPIIMALS